MKILKYLLVVIGLVFAHGQTLSQQNEDTTRYIWYKAQYGQKLPRVWATDVQRIPYGDTANFKPDAKSGAIMMHTTGALVGWHDGKWNIIQGGDASGKLNISDTAAMLSTYVRIQRFFDSCAALRTTINSKANQIALVDTAAAIRSAIGSGGGNALDKTNIDLGRLPAVKQRYPAQGLTATGTTVTNYPITALDSNALPFTTLTNFLAGTKYGGVLWPTPVGDSMRITAPFGVLIGSSFVEGHSGLHGRLHWLLSGVPQATLNPNYPDSVGQMSYHLRELTGYRWYNHGIGGQTSRQTWLRWMRDVAGDSISNTIDSRGSRTLSRKPYIVIYDGVGNDPYFGLTPDDSKMYLEFMSKWCQDNGARLVVFNSPTGLASTVAAYTHLETVNKWLEDGQLDKYGTVVFDLKRYWSDPAWNYDGIHMRPDISADGIHFTKAGYDSLSRWVFEVCKIPKITGIGIVNNLAPTNPVTNFAYTSGFTVQGTPYTMGSQSAVLPLLAPLTSDSVWVKATALTTVVGAGTRYGYGHWYWQLDNNISNDSLYTRKTNGSNAAQSNTPKITKMEIWPSLHLANESVFTIKNAANDNNAMNILSGSSLKVLINTTTELATPAVVHIGNAGQGNAIFTPGNILSDGANSRLANFEFQINGSPNTVGRGLSTNNATNSLDITTTGQTGKDGFRFRYHNNSQTFNTTTASLWLFSGAGFGDATGANQNGFGINIAPTVNQTQSLHTGIAFTGIRYAPTLTSLVNTRHRSLHTLRGNVYLNSISDSAGVGYDSNYVYKEKLQVNGGFRAEGKAVAQHLVQSGDTAYRFSPYLLSYFFGNSITAGSAITPQYYRWPTRVANGTNTIEVNYGIGGTRLVSLATGDSAMQERIFLIPTYNASRDKYLFFAYGTNDAVTGSIDTATFRSVYYTVIEDAIAKGWPLDRIILVSPGFFIHANSTLNARGPIFRDVVRSIAISKGVKFVDTRTAQVEVGEMQTLKLPMDSTHLNEYGNQVWSLAVLDTLGQKSGDVRANGYASARALHLRNWKNGGVNNAFGVAGNPVSISVTDSAEIVVFESRFGKGSSTNNEWIGQGINSLQYATGDGNVAFGPNAAANTTTGNYNLAFGSTTLYTNTTGDNNTAIGKNALFSNTTASENTAGGRDASYSNTTGTANAAWGYRSLRSGTTANNNSGFGHYTLEANTASGNGAFGASALRFNTSGSANNAFGANALLINTTGSSNTAFGNRALRGNTTASFNTSVGANAGDSVTTSGNNTLFGYRAGYNLKTGSGYNVLIGSEAGLTVTTGSENIIIGKAWNAGDVSGTLWLSPKQNEARIYSPTSGNVGIGTFLPTQKLHVAGAVKIETLAATGTVDSVVTVKDGVLGAAHPNSVVRTVINAGTSNFTITVGAHTILPSLAGAGNRTITLPSAAANTGNFIFVWNKNADANLWSYGTSYTEPNGTTATTIGNGSYHILFSTGSEWLRIQNN